MTKRAEIRDFAKPQKPKAFYTIARYMIVMETTIQVSGELRKALSNRKVAPQESYESVIWDLLEDGRELSEETKREMAEARKQIKEGKFKTLAQVKKELGL